MSDDIPDSQQISRDTAAELHNVAVRHGVRLAWIVMTGTVEYGDKFVARPWNENINRPFLNHLIANDLESIRGQLPPGLYRVPRQGWEISVIVEKWYDYCSHEHSAGKEDGMSDGRLDQFLWNFHTAIVDGTRKPESPEDRRFLALALCGEVGVLANVIKKEWRGDNDPEFDRKIDDELGDVYAYLRLLAVAYGRDLDEIMERVTMPKIKRRWVPEPKGPARSASGPSHD